jgi:sugar (pentulose or hexulose) kinase
VTVAGHDHLTAMVGAAATAEDDVLHESGTAEVFVRTAPRTSIATGWWRRSRPA